jgi:hypothetical protein
MLNHGKYIPFSFSRDSGSLILLASCAIALQLWTTDASAQQRGQRPVAAGEEAVAQSSSSKATAAADPNSPLGKALASCGKEPDRSEYSLPGGKSEVKLDRCYRGRGQNICSNNALLKEAKSLNQDYAKIIEAKYPELSNVPSVCAINPGALSTDVQKAAEFSNRFKALSAEYAARSNCSARVTQSMRDVALPDLAQAPEMIKSMIEAIEADSKELAVEQGQVVEVAGKMDASQKAMFTIGKIHQTMCIKEEGRNTVSDANK